MARLATGIWVSAYLHRLGAEGIFAHIMHRGDDTAGAVLVKLATMDGQASAYQRSFDLATGDRTWVTLTSGAEPDVDAAIARQRGFDPDLWVVEIEDPRGRHLLDDPTLSG